MSSDSFHINKTYSWRKDILRSSFIQDSKYFPTKKNSSKTLRTLDQIIQMSQPDKENKPQIQTHKAKNRVFRKNQTKIEKNTKKTATHNRILLTKNQKQENPWNLRDGIIFNEKQRQKSSSLNKPPSKRFEKEQQNQNCMKQSSKRISDYNIATLQEKCPFTRYQIYTLFSTFNAIISDSIAFKGMKLSFNIQRFINDVATMLKVEVDIVKRVFVVETRKKYYAINKNFQFLDFLSFVDQVRKQSLRQKVNDFLNLLFDMEKQSLNYEDLLSLFSNKNNQKDCETYITKLFSTLMKPKSDSVKKQELKQLFEANQDMLQIFRKIVTI